MSRLSLLTRAGGRGCILIGQGDLLKQWSRSLVRSTSLFYVGLASGLSSTVRRGELMKKCFVCMAAAMMAVVLTGRMASALGLPVVFDENTYPTNPENT